MLLIVIMALVTYTCMVVSNKLRKPVAIIGTVIMLVYCIAGSIFPIDKVFEKFPVKTAILIFIPCTVYLIGLAIYISVKEINFQKDKLENPGLPLLKHPVPPPPLGGHIIPPPPEGHVPPPSEGHIPPPPGGHVPPPPLTREGHLPPHLRKK